MFMWTWWKAAPFRWFSPRCLRMLLQRSLTAGAGEWKENKRVVVLLQHCCPDATPFTEIYLDKQQEKDMQQQPDRRPRESHMHTSTMKHHLYATPTERAVDSHDEAPATQLMLMWEEVWSPSREPVTLFMWTVSCCGRWKKTTYSCLWKITQWHPMTVPLWNSESKINKVQMQEEMHNIPK